MQLDTATLQKMSNTIRFLAADMVQKANSGHPGMPMGLADLMSVFHFHYRHNPKDPKWLNRDRVVFSGGHGSALVYSLLHLWGYDVSLTDLQNFRQMDSKTPGHPECGHTPGVEVTTGPLGQGVANAVGFALAGKQAAKLLNTESSRFIDHKVWCFCGDGDLMEGISYEAASIAGHRNLNNLVLFYDSNNITIDGNCDLSFSEDVAMRFRAQGWEVLSIDGHDYEEIGAAFEAAAKQKAPLLVITRTRIGRGAASMEGSHKTHGAPLGEEEIAASKAKAGWPNEPFHVPEDVAQWFSSAVEKGDLAQREWQASLNQAPFKEQNDLLKALQSPDFSAIEWPEFSEAKATRETNHACLNAIAKALPGFIGGSADLASSNKTELKGLGEVPGGRNIHYGIREHAMAAISNAISLYGLFIPFNATFFVFSDYQKPAVRTAALMGAKNYFVWTHDSIGVGEDGATHQPIEQISSFRALPGFDLFRPADGGENAACWMAALSGDKPAGFVLSRQGLPVLDRTQAVGEIEKGAYLLSPAQNPQLTLLASGSEVSLALEAKKLLEDEGIATAVVSVPCFDRLCEQDEAYVDRIIDPQSTVLAIEAASAQEWFRFADGVLGMESFGASAPAKALFESFGFTPSGVVEVAKSLLE
jgi:transketolase